ncbi:Ltp family lipoprotein [Staphylococcus haemolyticus]|nr:Ltp family lipoprotein [Staphylococcus haemolyticus]
MDKETIYNQLTSSYGEKFTQKEAQYAIDHLDK